MILFTDKRLYVKGTCAAIASDPATGNILYFSNKFQTGNFSTSVTMGEIRAGLGNSVAAIIPSDAAVNVEFTAADFSLWAKAAQVGATLNYNAPVMTYQDVTASNTTLSINVDNETPVAQLGYSEALAYVQKIGDSSPIATYGTAYPIDSNTGVISGFSAEEDAQYKVWYFVNKASAQVATLSSLFDPKVVHFTARIAVYSNESGDENNEGTRVGWIYAIVPRLKLGGNAGLVGDQSTADTTSLSGQAVTYDSDIITAESDGCSSSTLAYYVYVPDDQASQIAGLAVVGGVVDMQTNSTLQFPVKYVMANGELVTPNYSDLTYTLEGTISGTSISESGVISAGATAGDCEVVATYQGSTTYTVTANLSVSAAS